MTYDMMGTWYIEGTTMYFEAKNVYVEIEEKDLEELIKREVKDRVHQIFEDINYEEMVSYVDHDKLKKTLQNGAENYDFAPIASRYIGKWTDAVHEKAITDEVEKRISSAFTKYDKQIQSATRKIGELIDRNNDLQMKLLKAEGAI